MKKMDFVIIGAQKSATTALFSYLKSHPKIEMPKAKEAPFFTSADTNEEDWQAFCKIHFEDNNRLWGKASPQYMADEKIPERLYQHNSSLKLIAILRDPIDRAYSNYQMAQRRDTESRSFDQAVAEGLDESKLNKARKGSPPLHEKGYVPESDFYFVWGEYGRILKDYLAVFPRTQLLVLNTKEIKESPEESLDKVLSFIGLEKGFRPDNLGEVVHKGGQSSIIPASLPRKLVSLPIFVTVWRCVPESLKQTLRYWFEQFNVKKSSGKVSKQISDDSRAVLTAFYSPDIQCLIDEIGVDIPWADKYKVK